MLALFASTLSFPGHAQTNDEIESIREERRRVQEEEKDKAKEVNVADAELEQISAALAALSSSVNAQEGRVEDAQRQFADAQLSLAEAEQAVVDGEVAIESLKQQLADRAISSFVNQGAAPILLMETDDPNLAIRMQSLVDDVTQADVDIADTLRAAEEDLAVERARAVSAAEDAEELRAEMEDELAILEEDRQAQAVLTEAAEVRLDHLLSERAALKTQGFQLDKDLQDAQDAYAAELARRTATAPSGPGGAKPPVASPGEIVNAGNGIWVHQSIVGNVSRLLSAASAAGVPLAGGGYRDPSGQIAVRKNNCGTSDYAIYQMPASQCRPPTARPGTSMHERGLAIDFTYNGRIIGSRSGPAWTWLKANAASYGLYNLPSEPWHWSTSGG